MGTTAKKYQIEATIEKFGENSTIQLKGCSKYRFEDSNKKYWNIFECPDGSGCLIKKQEEPIQIGAFKCQCLLEQAFIEEKKFKFELTDSEPESKPLTMSSISNVSS